MKNKLIVANWKMNGDFAQAQSWVSSFLDSSSRKMGIFDKVTSLFCPPAILIDESSADILEYAFDKADIELAKEGKKADDIERPEVAAAIDKYRTLKVGAQDCHGQDGGSYTGDLSAKMVASLGSEYVIVGHSERRKNHLETNEYISSKVKAVAEQSMIPILCVGESKEVRDLNKHLGFVNKQLISSTPKGVNLDHLVVAYEPIWAIGTGDVPSMAQIQEMTNLIKEVLDRDFSSTVQSYSILYGGSVNVKNASEILAVKNLDGLLIGKASLNATDFFTMCEKAYNA